MDLKGWIAPTDQHWFEFLAGEKGLDEVNFWQPGGGRQFRAISPGQPVFFKLKRGINKIGGFGYLTRSQILPVWLAWQTFGRANGVSSLEEMEHRIAHYRKRFDSGNDPRIGCLMICDPVFFPRDEYVDPPADWPSNVVQGKTYDLSTGEGKRVLDECVLRAKCEKRTSKESFVSVPPARYGNPVRFLPRLGQGSFRLAVIDAYGACAVTSEHSLPVLEASHIKPYSEGGEHRVSNGLLLRSDIHRLFDGGYVTITPKLEFEVSNRLKEEYDNGKIYYQLHGTALHCPATPELKPEAAMLAWHNEHRYRP